MQIVVLGMHRSGTSAVARILNMMGAYFGQEGSALDTDQHNPKGYWERKDVVGLNDDLLKAGGSNWFNVVDFNIEKISLQEKSQFENQAKKLVADLDNHRPWMIKDPRFSTTFPLWRPLLTEPICIVVYRSPLQVAQSLLRRDMFPLHVGLSLWEFSNLAIFKSINGLQSVFVDYGRLMEEPVDTAGKLYDGLVGVGVRGLRQADKKEIESFITPELFRNRGDKVSEIDHINDQQKNILSILESNIIPETAPALSPNDLTR